MIQSGMTDAEAMARDQQRAAILSSSLVTSGDRFDSSQAAGLLANHADDMTARKARWLLKGMTKEHLLDEMSVRGRVYFFRKQVSMKHKKWVESDNGIRLGHYFPHLAGELCA